MTYFRRPENAALEGRTLAEVAADAGGHMADVIADLLLAEDFRITFVRPSPQATTLPAFVVHPLSMIGTDGVLLGAYPSPRAFGTYPRILGDYVREEGLLSMADAIRRMTSFPATAMGLAGRGVLADGMAADIVVFDPLTVRATATYEAPRSAPVGISHVVVNGTLVVDGAGTLAPLPAVRCGAAWRPEPLGASAPPEYRGEHADHRRSGRHRRHGSGQRDLRPDRHGQGPDRHRRDRPQAPFALRGGEPRGDRRVPRRQGRAGDRGPLREALPRHVLDRRAAARRRPQRRRHRAVGSQGAVLQRPHLPDAGRADPGRDPHVRPRGLWRVARTSSSRTSVALVERGYRAAKTGLPLFYGEKAIPA